MPSNKDPKASHIDALGFAVSLANLNRKSPQKGRKNFNECSQGDWLNLQEGYFAFVNASAETSPDSSKANWLKDITAQRLREIASIFDAKLRKAANGEPLDAQHRGVLNFLAQAHAQEDTFKPVMFLDASVGSAEVALWLHLTWSGITRGQVRACPVCDALTLLPKKPQAGKDYYCSLRCSRRAAYDAYVLAHGGKRIRAKTRRASKRRAAR